MNKTTTQTLLICIILLVGFLSFFNFHIKEVHATVYKTERCESLVNWTFANEVYYDPSLNADCEEGSYSIQFENLTNAGSNYEATPDVINEGSMPEGVKCWGIWFKSVARNTNQNFRWGVADATPDNYLQWEYDYSAPNYNLNGLVRGDAGSQSQNIIADLTLNTWYWLEMVWNDANNQTFWVDGNLEHTFTARDMDLTAADYRFRASTTESLGQVRVDYILFTSEETYPPIPSTYECRVDSSPEINVDWELDSVSYTTPWNDNMTEGSRNLLCSDFEVSVNSSYKYTFDHWSINGSGYYGSLSIDVEIGGETNLTMHYTGSWIISPYVPTFTHDALSGTWYFRSDTHTIHEILAYKLDTVNSNTAIYDSRSIAGTYNISYGIRVWIIGILGNNYELSGGTPEAIVLRSSNGNGSQSAYFECPAYIGLIDAVQVNLYQRFNEEPWSLRRYFITDENLYIKLPASSWTIHYHTNRTTASTTAYFYHGSTSFNSRILFQYYRANPWELALARLQAQNYFGFMTTPWTYYLGDIFWSLLLLFGIVTMYNRVGSLKPILALLWLLGGVGSVLSALIPALVLHIAWLMLAVAMGITLFKLIYR